MKRTIEDIRERWGGLPAWVVDSDCVREDRGVEFEQEIAECARLEDARRIAHAPADVAYLLAEVDRLSAEVEQFKSAPIVRRPIETLPDEREDAVILTRAPAPMSSSMDEARILHPDEALEPWQDHPDNAPTRWTHWSPLPPLAGEEAEGTEPGHTCPYCGGTPAEHAVFTLDGPDWRCLDEWPHTTPEVSDLLVQGWEMPEAPEEGAVAKAYYCEGEDVGWDLVWEGPSGVAGGGWVELWTPDPIPWPFRDGVTVTPDMLRSLGFTVEDEE